jgi:hypothetical protein
MIIKKNLTLKVKTLTPSDFTVIAQNLPLNKDEKDIKKFFEGVLNEEV